MRIYLLRLMLAAILMPGLSAPTAGKGPLLVKSLADSGRGTLRSAMERANSMPGDNVIVILIDGTISLLSPLPSIVETITISGNGESVIISGALLSASESGAPIFDVPVGSHLNIDGLTIQDSDFGGINNAGESRLADCRFDRNAFTEGGAIVNTGLLTIQNCVFTANQSYLGGAIRNSGTLLLDTVLFERNHSDVDAGAIYNSGTLEGIRVDFTSNIADEDTGGALENTGKARLEDSHFTGNQVHNGGGAIGSWGELVLVNVEFQKNNAKWGGAIINFASGSVDMRGGLMQENFAGGHFGGAIENDGKLTIDGAQLRGNGSAEDGGAISSSGEAHITNTIFDSNASGNGGGLVIWSGRVEILSGCVFLNNQAEWNGGAIASGGNLTISEATFASNRALRGSGGAIENDGVLTLDQTTLTANTAAEYGGGISNQTHGSVAIHNATFDANTALTGGGAYNNGKMQIAFTTLAGNASPNGAALANLPGAQMEISYSIAAESAQSANCSGAFTTGTLNIADDSSCGPGFLTGDPLLEPLAQNGGSTFTHLLQPGSPAIDVDFSTECPISWDQRGLHRPMAVGCDAGAVEMEQIEVQIDVIPKSTANKINPASPGNIPVAILARAGFDAPRIISITSLTFGRTGWELSLFIAPSGRPACSVRDVNADSLPDVLCQFMIHSAALRCGDKGAILRGRTLNGEWIVGQDMIQTNCQ